MEWFIIPSLSDFMAQGGTILYWLGIAMVIYWLLVIERLLFFYFSFPILCRRWIEEWRQRNEHQSWYARTVRDAWISEAHLQLNQYLHIIKTLVAIFPMLGLLGTVIGMISLFDLMAEQGNPDVKLIASGISLATIPTMVGMVAALIGLFIYTCLVKLCQRKAYCFTKKLRYS